jgi:glycosyltransferase involved in cell wall biosynthesis
MLRNMGVNINATQTPAVEEKCKGDACLVEISEDHRKDMEAEAKALFFKGVQRDDWPDQSTKDPKVTLAMIVRDESAHIRDCLESMKDHVDEIVVIDTGSTDNTVAICKEYGARVYNHPWEDSFSVARNYAIKYVRTPWLIQLDADEMMSKEDAAKVRDVVRSSHATTANLIHMILVNKAKDDDEVMSVVNTGKIMRVQPELYFTNRVHNRLHCKGDVIQTNLTIVHHGYSLPDKDTMSKKKDRTTRLLKMQREEQPDDPETSHYLCIQYLRMDDWEMAIEIGKQAIELWKKFEPTSQLQLLSTHTVAMANYQLGSRCKTREDQQKYFNEAIKYSEMALATYPDYIDSNCLLSSIYFATKDHKNCEKYSIKFLQVCDMLKNDKTKALVIPMMSLKHEWMVCLQMAINHFEQADSEKAFAFVIRGEGILPPESKYKLSWGVFKYMITLGDPVSLKNAEAIYQVGYRPE